MSGFSTTDLREGRVKEYFACDAQFRADDPFSLCLLGGPHGTHEGSFRGERVRWRQPMTPRREERAPLTWREIADVVGPVVDIRHGCDGVPIVTIGGRPFREVT